MVSRSGDVEILCEMNKGDLGKGCRLDALRISEREAL